MILTIRMSLRPLRGRGLRHSPSRGGRRRGCSLSDGWRRFSGSRLAIAGVFAGSTLLVYFVGPGLLSVGLIAAAGNQAFERRARGEPYAGPSPILVFAAAVAVTYFVGAAARAAARGRRDVDRRPMSGHLPASSSPPPSPRSIFIGLLRLTVVGTGALTWSEMGIRRFDRRAVGRHRRRRIAGAAGDRPDTDRRRRSSSRSSASSVRARCRRPANCPASSSSSSRARSSPRSPRRSCSAASR